MIGALGTDCGAMERRWCDCRGGGGGLRHTGATANALIGRLDGVLWNEAGDPSFEIRAESEKAARPSKDALPM